MSKYPTGVECHGGTLRVWFMYQGKRCRESLAVPDTPKNRKIAGELRTSICFAIKTGTFNYATQFPQSQNLARFSIASPGISLGKLSDRWIGLKRMEVSKNTLRGYQSYIDGCIRVIGEEKNVSDITNEDILMIRKELMIGNQSYSHPDRASKAGRSSRTVNSYMGILSAVLEFAESNGYIEKSPMKGIKPLRKSKPDPDPLTRDEYQRMIAAFTSEQIKNLWVLAVNTGMRHGEISALSWEDIDTVTWTITICRNIAIKGHFTTPKTEAGNRDIKLTQPAIQALKNQMAYTRMGRQHDIDVHLREHNKTRRDMCTFVFVPSLTARNGSGGNWYSPGSLGDTWNYALKRAGVRHRRAYESRHTFACWALSAGANPNFIAAQMGHTSAQMVFNVYGKWMKDNDGNQLAILNENFNRNAPMMPHASNGS
ncbi:Arm DNA-binding domain-containing protein [Pectobacterium brasiliense]|uniref:site-specific integrase n=1 Tax=Pectobacterium brasiliense TaxID=180957 RepID=UPI000B963D4D|nr:site-specific integrase [Pectobacterium carotovorum]OYN49410.1 site-specific integrase [Pectobacterium carotovorum]